MAKRASRRPLYDLIASGQPRGLEERRRHVPPSADDAPREGGWRPLGRIVRMPSGYIFLACGGVLLLLVLAYVLGYARAEQKHDDAVDEQIRDSVARLELRTDPPEDPLSGGEGRSSRPTGDTNPPVRDPGRTGLNSPDNSETGPTTPNNGGQYDDQADRTRMEADWGPIESDPRIQGRQYRVVATTRREGALRLAEFLRSQGLEAYAIGNDNPLLRVIVLPGFQNPRSTDPAVVRLMQSIERAGEIWKSRHPGESDLKDSYWSLF